MEQGRCQYFCYNFQKEVIDRFRLLREQSEGFDVILGVSSPDSTNIVCMQAHKMLIAASSPLLGNILKSNDELGRPSSPFLYLGEINQKDLNYILAFIYNGEIQVASEDVSSFISTAQDLQIRGIAKLHPEVERSVLMNHTTPDLPQKITNVGNIIIPSFNTSMQIPNSNWDGTLNSQFTMPVIKTEPQAPKKLKLEKPVKIKKEPNKLAATTKNVSISGEKKPVGEQFKKLSADQFKEWKEKFSTSDGNVFNCHQCPETKSFTLASSLLRHYKTSHELACKCCKMPFYDEHRMEEHFKASHEFPCGFCDKVFTLKSSVGRHHKTEHAT